MSELRGTATKIFLEGEDKKKLEFAKVTTCEAGQNEWFITSEETVIDQSSGKIKAKDAYLSLKGIPIMYSPYVDFSLTSQRKSGWLLPTAGSQQLLVGLKFQSHITSIYHLLMMQRLQQEIWQNVDLQFDGEFRYMKRKF